MWFGKFTFLHNFQIYIALEKRGYMYNSNFGGY